MYLNIENLRFLIEAGECMATMEAGRSGKINWCHLCVSKIFGIECC